MNDENPARSHLPRGRIALRGRGTTRAGEGEVEVGWHGTESHVGRWELSTATETVSTGAGERRRRPQVERLHESPRVPWWRLDGGQAQEGGRQLGRLFSKTLTSKP